MGKIVIFSGTTEGREISSFLSKRGAEHIVCVATEYGRDIMPTNRFSTIHTGRMDIDEMRSFLQETGEIIAVVDATHPYATLVSDNIRSITGELNLKYIRVIRESRQTTEAIDFDALSGILSKKKGNILLTTGSKELHRLELDKEILERIYVRVIPSAESIKLCENAGIPRKNIIAMQGPFSTAMNEALIREKNISCLVTKESGSTGGFDEKIEACENCGIDLVVIGRPCEEKGVSLEQAKTMISGFAGIEKKEENHVKISLIGMGMGNLDCMTIEASKLLEEADMVFGPARLLKDIKDKPCKPVFRAAEILPEILENKPKDVVVLFSGDCGFYSGATSFLKQMDSYLSEYGIKAEVKCYAGISSVSYFAAALGESYSDAYITSIHGKQRDRRVLAQLKEDLYRNAKTFVLLSGDADIREIGKLLEGDNQEEKEQFQIILGSDLSYPEEKIFTLSPKEAEFFDIPGLYIALIKNNTPRKELFIKHMRDDDFIRNKTPMTKDVIRAEVVRLLQIKNDDTVFDLGSGTGSVSIEVANLSPGVTVYAVEKKDEACECMRANLEKFNCANVHLIQGDALDEIKKLDVPDSVFIGGSSGEIKDILDTFVNKLDEKKDGSRKSIRVVITAISLETISEMEKISKREDISEFEMKQIAVTNTRKVGEYNLLQAENPVFICAFNLGKVTE